MLFVKRNESVVLVSRRARTNADLGNVTSFTTSRKHRGGKIIPLLTWPGALCTFNRYLFLFSEWIIMISITGVGGGLVHCQHPPVCSMGGSMKFCMYSDCSKAILLLIATHANVNFRKI